MNGVALPLASQWTNVHLVPISGIPGVGKSTLVRRLRESGCVERKLAELGRMDGVKCTVTVRFVLEPSDLWRERGWLSAYYERPNVNALAFQFLVFKTHTDAVLRVVRDWEGGAFDPARQLVVFVERCMFDQLLFWRTQGDMEYESAGHLQNEAYTALWRTWDAFIPPVSLLFFLSTSNIQRTMKRVAARGRGEELNNTGVEDKPGSRNATPSPPPRTPSPDIDNAGGLTLDYQRMLLTKHNEWYTAPRAQPPLCTRPFPCVHLDADGPYHNSAEALQRVGGTMAAHLHRHIVLGKIEARAE